MRISFAPLRGAVGAAHELTGREDSRAPVPLLATDRLRGGLQRAQSGRGMPVQFLPVVDRPVEVELLAQFDLPLLEHRLRGENQDALGSACQPGLTQQQASLNGLAQAHFIGDQQFGRPGFVHPLKGADLVRPGLHAYFTP